MSDGMGLCEDVCNNLVGSKSGKRVTFDLDQVIGYLTKIQLFQYIE